MSPKTRMLVRAADLELSEQKKRALVQEMVHQEDLDGSLAAAVQEGLGCLLYGHLKRARGLEILPSESLRGLQRLYEQTVAFNFRLIQDFKEVLSCLNRNGIRVVILQGMALLHQVYGGNIGLRSMTDIDLWVCGDQYPYLIDLLTGMGYRRDQTYPNIFKKGITSLDLHTHFLWADRIRARRHLIRLDQDAIYREVVPIDFESEKAFILSPRDQVLYLGLHAFKHNLDRLIWFVDIKLLLQGFDPGDWAGLIHRARDLGLNGHLRCVLYLLHHLFQLDPPLEVRRLLGNGTLGMIEKRLLQRRVEGKRLPSWGPLLLLLPEEGMAKRLFYLLEASVPREEVLRQIFVDYPELKRWQLYWMRILQLLGKIRLASRGL
jgi:hypothetical protein